LNVKKKLKFREGLEDLSRSNSRQYVGTTALDQHLNLFATPEKLSAPSQANAATSHYKATHPGNQPSESLA